MMPLCEELPRDLQPWHAFRRLAHLPYVLFLDSAMRHPTLGRYSYVTAAPRRTLLLGSERHDPFDEITRELERFPAATIPGLPPFQGGVAGLFGYELCHKIERLPRPAIDDFQVPDVALGCFDWVVSFDHFERRAWIVSTGYPYRERWRTEIAGQRIEKVLGLLEGDASTPAPTIGQRIIEPHRVGSLPGLPHVSSNFTRDEYLRTVQRAIDYVHAGDCLQVNVAQRLLTPAVVAPIELYARLRERNAAPYAGYFDLGEHVVLSASPELFLRVRDGEVETRPIKGTRRVAGTLKEDRVVRQQLLQSEKDRAENVMIVDLLRNDLGRVCEYGSIGVPAVCELETYRYVHHLVSAVRGRLRHDRGPVDLLKAAFPGGSITGAPKIRAMEIITELEGVSRGAYCGSLGYVGFDGAMDTNLLIRTITHGRGWLQFPVGGGIVADSDPDAEYAETLHKAEGLLRALE